MTGGGYFFGFTFMDKLDFNQSHHLLDCFQFASEDDLDNFYSKIRKCFGGVTGTGNINDAIAVTRESEFEITSPRPASPDVVADSVRGASPYIYNTSVRSNFGMCGIHADGSKVTGAKSMVVAQFTGCSLQNDYSVWQKYVGGTWVPVTSGSDYVGVSPNDLRMDPQQRSFHIRGVNNAVLQLVSVFAIGQGVHQWAASGAEITTTNSNSNFGGVAALADGFKETAADADQPWKIEEIKRGLDPYAKGNNKKRIFLGVLTDSETNTTTKLMMDTPLGASPSDPTQPELLTRDGYSLQPGDYLWVENPAGPDYRAQLDATPWSSVEPDAIRIAAPLVTDNADGNIAPGTDTRHVDIASQRVYIRRFRDVRTIEERRFTIATSSTGSPRLPVRDYIIQQVGGTWESRLQAVAGSSKNARLAGADVELRYERRPQNDTEHKTDVFYRKADVVRKDNKHYFCVRDHMGAFDPANWDESHVHMEESYAPGGYFTNAQPILIFDKDADESESSTTMGTTLDDVKPQIVSAVDYQGVNQLLRNLGYSSNAAQTELELQPSETRILDVSSNDWNVEYRRPSNIRLFGHSFEWAGYSNYSKALPQYQQQLTPNNQFTYYFTNQDGGKVYASGFNQEGLQVSPRGLEDITTGKVLALEDIANPDREIEVPTEFETLNVKELTVDNITINGLIEGGDASTEQQGVVELATREETALFAATDLAVTPDSLNSVRGEPDTFATLDSGGKVPLSQLPDGVVNSITNLTPVQWVAGTDNLANSNNFFYQESTDGALLQLGTPIAAGHEGKSGFILVTRAPGVTTRFTGINDAVWRSTTNTWISPVDEQPGLPGVVLLGYYVANDGRFVYNASMLDN